MKIGLLAYHYALNYGAVLQIASLQRKIQSMGHECKIINYYTEGTLQWDKYRKVTLDKNLLSEMKWNTYLFLVKKRKRKTFDEFLSGLDMTMYIDSEKKLNLEEQFDAFIVGSDQVWNCYTMDLDSTYFLDFVSDKKKKNAYAASFGYSVIPEEYREFTNKYLENFNHISVRETQGKEIIKDLKGLDTPVVLDPVFFSTVADWKLKSERIIKEKYVLVYQPQKSSTLGKRARKIAKENGCKVVYVSRTWDGVIGANTINMSTVSPRDFLRLLRDAEVVITNSFHGTAFSIIFRKQFWVEYNEGTSSRIESVLKTFALANRELSDRTTFVPDPRIDYHEVDAKLKELLDFSEHYLEQIINM